MKLRKRWIIVCPLRVKRSKKIYRSYAIILWKLLGIICKKLKNQIGLWKKNIGSRVQPGEILSYQQGYAQFVYNVDCSSTKFKVINKYHNNIKDPKKFQQKGKRYPQKATKNFPLYPQQKGRKFVDTSLQCWYNLSVVWAILETSYRWEKPFPS